MMPTRFTGTDFHHYLARKIYTERFIDFHQTLRRNISGEIHHTLRIHICRFLQCPRQRHICDFIVMTFLWVHDQFTEAIFIINLLGDLIVFCNSETVCSHFLGYIVENLIAQTISAISRKDINGCNPSVDFTFFPDHYNCNGIFTVQPHTGFGIRRSANMFQEGIILLICFDKFFGDFSCSVVA